MTAETDAPLDVGDAVEIDELAVEPEAGDAQGGQGKRHQMPA